jgi:hypothetical protein
VKCADEIGRPSGRTGRRREGGIEKSTKSGMSCLIHFILFYYFIIIIISGGCCLLTR